MRACCECVHVVPVCMRACVLCVCACCVHVRVVHVYVFQGRHQRPPPSCAPGTQELASADRVQTSFKLSSKLEPMQWSPTRCKLWLMKRGLSAGGSGTSIASTCHICCDALGGNVMKRAGLDLAMFMPGDNASKMRSSVAPGSEMPCVPTMWCVPVVCACVLCVPAVRACVLAVRVVRGCVRVARVCVLRASARCACVHVVGTCARA